MFIEFGDRWFCLLVLESAAFLAAATGHAERAVRLLGAADAILRAIDAPLMARFRDRHDHALADARSRLGDSRFAVAWDEGGRVPLPDTVELVTPAVQPDAGPPAPEGLTARELEVLAIVATGSTDAEVAEQLVLSIRTVQAHLRSIFRKLDVRTRSAATRYALEHQLVG